MIGAWVITGPYQRNGEWIITAKGPTWVESFAYRSPESANEGRARIEETNDIVGERRRAMPPRRGLRR